MPMWLSGDSTGFVNPHLTDNGGSSPFIGSKWRVNCIGMQPCFENKWDYKVWGSTPLLSAKGIYGGLPSIEQWPGPENRE